MDGKQKQVARNLMEAFLRFKRLNWKQSPIAGLRPSEIMVLYCIQHKATDASGIRISEISSTLRVTSPTITQLINDLEAKGYVDRTTDKEDRRAVRVRLTDAGEKAIRKASDAFLSLFVGLVEYLGEKDSNLLAELLSRVFVYFNEVRQRPL
ncbi:MAG: winged helix DNA-binding protein [Clostridia bacterium]|nr:winged helix DNA-binding protein [Clostridia bacterium]